MPAGMYLSWLSDTRRAVQTAGSTRRCCCPAAGRRRRHGRPAWCGCSAAGPGSCRRWRLRCSRCSRCRWRCGGRPGSTSYPCRSSLFWGLASLVTHLRTRRPRPLVVSVVWVVAGLLFYEKTLLVSAASRSSRCPTSPPAPCATGSGTPVAATYRAAVLDVRRAGPGLPGRLLPLRAELRPARRRQRRRSTRSCPNMLLHTYLPGVVGGPLHWRLLERRAPCPRPATRWSWSGRRRGRPGAPRDPPRPDPRSLRAWLLPGFFLLCDVVLVLAGRASSSGR